MQPTELVFFYDPISLSVCPCEGIGSERLGPTASRNHKSPLVPLALSEAKAN